MYLRGHTSLQTQPSQCLRFRDRTVSAVWLKVRWDAHHVAFTVECLLTAATAVKHTEEVGSCRGVSGIYSDQLHIWNLGWSVRGPHGSGQWQRRFFLFTCFKKMPEFRFGSFKSCAVELKCYMTTYLNLTLPFFKIALGAAVRLPRSTFGKFLRFRFDHWRWPIRNAVFSPAGPDFCTTNFAYSI